MRTVLANQLELNEILRGELPGRRAWGHVTDGNQLLGCSLPTGLPMPSPHITARVSLMRNARSAFLITHCSMSRLAVSSGWHIRRVLVLRP
jgi:hypothetical protein